MSRTIEMNEKGIQFVSKQERMLSDEPIETVTDEIGWDELPVEHLRIEGVSRIDADVDNNDDLPTSIRLEFDTVEKVEVPDNGNDEAAGFFEKLEAETGITWDSRKKEFEFDNSKSDKQNFVDFAAFLFNQGHIETSDLPYATPYARKAWLLNTKPTHQDGSEMERVGEPIEGVYMPTYYGADQKKNYMATLVNDFVKGHHIDT
ncbi:hypothetical protein SVXHr_2623 [Halorhabdus sp. SVX81]|uniref:hypothetical protein n=1 Tax=Halorhabdus sp. SVX81 TaxID=2978283 RepID=UPI0023DB80ED|nr:hypothetical protein [Halorhabdus sp. SVX81]WEL18767.1 hypothetical protein SVXHr_2623 [Halorhabdus sp. SVX81]